MGKSADEMRRVPGVVAVPPDAPETVQIEADIAQTRAEMGETIDAIQQRLASQQLTEQAKDAAREVAHEVMQEAKVQALDVVEQTKAQALDAVEQAKGSVREATVGKAQQMVQRAREMGRHAMQHPRETAKQAGSTVLGMLKQHPRPAALTGLGLGGILLLRQLTARRSRRRYAEAG